MRGCADDQRSGFIQIIDFLPSPSKSAPRDRSNRLLEADRSDDALFRARDCGYQIRNQQDEIVKSIRLGSQQNDSNLEFR